MIHLITETAQNTTNVLSATIFYILILIATIIIIGIFSLWYINRQVIELKKMTLETNKEMIKELLNEIERRYGSDTIKTVFKKDQK